MKKYFKRGILALSVLLVLSLVVMFWGGLNVPVQANTTITVSGTPWGVSTAYIGVCEGSADFKIDDLLDLGINTYRIWGGMGRWEWEDADGVYGSPTIAEIKADPNVINWTWWENAFHNPPHGSAYHWTYSERAWHGNDATMLQQLKDNGIEAVITLRQYHREAEAPWAKQLNPPQTAEDWNEWWGHVFATVYYINVINDWQVDRWQVHNEPDTSSQGWEGTMADYYLFAQYTNDAIKYVYDTYLPGRQYWVLAPVTKDGSSWPREVLINAGDHFNTMDIHAYSRDNTSYINKVHGWMDTYGASDWELWVSEWGEWKQNKYDGFAFVKAYFAPNLIRGCRPGHDHVDGNHLFSLYDWVAEIERNDYVSGVIAPDGTRRLGYYALRLAARGLKGARTTYEVYGGILAIATQDENGDIYVTMGNTSSGTVTLDLSALLPSGSYSCTLWHWSETVKDEIVAYPTVNDGLVTFTTPSGAALIKVHASLDPPEPGDPPAAPTGLTAAAVSSSRIDLNWDDNTESDLDGYNVYRDTSPGVTAAPANLVAAGVSSSEYNDTGLDPETTYYYVVTAVNTSSQVSGASNEASATTQQATGDPVIHVNDMLTTDAAGNPKSVYSPGEDLYFRVQVFDENNSAVEGASVSTRLERPNGSHWTTLTETTGSNGWAFFSRKLPGGGPPGSVYGTWLIEVTNVSKSGYTYDPTKNVITSINFTIE